MGEPLRVSLKAARVNRRLTLEEAAKLIGVTSRTLSNWECGKTSPKSTLLYKLADVYNTPLESISLPDVSTLSEKGVKR